MRHVRIWAAMLGVLLFAAACVDAPTAPNAVAGARRSGPSKYMLEPVIVVGQPSDPGCNPYTDLNFCQGSEIANTALHEAAHVLGFSHPAGKTWVGLQDHYTDVPLNLLSPGTNACIVY